MDEKKDLEEIIDTKNLKSNSNKTKAATRERTQQVSHTEIQKVVKSTTKIRKKPLSKRLSNALFSESIDNVGRYILVDVILPSIKETIGEVIKGSIDMLLNGDASSRHSSSRYSSSPRRSSSAYVPYDRYSRSAGRDRETRRSREQLTDFRDIIFEERGDADEVLFNLYEMVDEYGEASVANLYELSGHTPRYTDNGWGWYEIEGSRIVKVRDGFILDLPSPEPLKKR